jgi:hypothetical protein
VRLTPRAGDQQDAFLAGADLVFGFMLHNVERVLGAQELPEASEEGQHTPHSWFLSACNCATNFLNISAISGVDDIGTVG